VPDEIPKQIGRYEIRRVLGRGAMGVVYEAWDPTLDRVIALKAIRVGEAVPAEELRSFEERFLSEARAAARLSHPGIVVVHDVGRDPESGTLFMALEHLHGRTLSELLAGNTPLDWREALRLAAGIARALHHAHSRGIVHRDVKPANVMLLETGGIKVMDFGIAKLQAAHAQLTSTGQFFGTPLYMSPEQALGEKVDGRSDLFSLGVVAYQLLTGVRLFEAESVPRIMTRVAYEPARPPSEQKPWLSAHVDAVLMKLLAKNPGERYVDGLSLAEDLERVAAGQAPLQADPPVGESTAVAARTAAPAPAVPTAAPGMRPADRTTTLGTRARPSPPPGARAPGPAARGGERRPFLVAAALLLVVGVVAGAMLARGGSDMPFVASGPTPAAKPTPTPDADATPLPDPTPAPRDAPTPVPAPEATPTPAGASATPESDLATLEIDFEHHYKSGRIRVWVDRQPVLDEQLGGRVRAQVAGVVFRSGYVGAEIPVAPGRREVTVQVDWDDNSRFGTLAGSFEEQGRRRLRVRIDRFIKKMSLDWS
jgi:serine/threonine-protein kinase